MQTDVQAQLVPIWQELLGVQEINPSSDFFDLGGNSLTAIKLLARVEAAFGADALSPDALFANPQLEQIARAITGTLEARGARAAG